MPIYEYQCPQCQHRFEEWVKSPSDQGEEPCPKCGTAAPRIMSQTSFVLKGGGWYVDDYGYRKGVKEEGSSSASSTPSEASAPSGAAETTSTPAKGAESAASSAAASSGAAKAPAAAPAPVAAPATPAPKASAAKPTS
ncbi:FmdB family zinc ribbon protein [Desulfovibrio intestinalis]|uniref:FmdB family zinc ribbon protein n=1 Tax=Desulfovibrio intestinalis TaxID=58621 RepID=UPI001613BBBE|nr:zinc ribbon domain-containing protein [Desulfovibrio intestinalis]